jgi:hypothetical protein
MPPVLSTLRSSEGRFAIGQIGHSLITMGLAVLKKQDWILYGSPGYSGLAVQNS